MHIGPFIGSGSIIRDLDGYVGYAAQAERDGFDSIWYAQLMGADVLTVIALAGQKTSRIEMGTAVVPSFPRHPLVMAQQAMTAQAATDGRLALGIGLSHKVTIEKMLGLSFDRPARHMREYLSVLRALTHEGGASFEGQTFRVNASIAVAGATPPPILVAALGPRMLQIAGELADGTITWMVGVRTLETHIVPGIAESARAAGRPEPRICAGVPVAVTDDRDAAMQAAARSFQGFDRLPSYRSMLDIEGAAGPADVAVVGDESRVEQELRRYADAGATDLLATIFPVDADPEKSIARTWSLLRGLVGKI
jgi:5,10-methylenetetrahydromethanopterin reductase